MSTSWSEPEPTRRCTCCRRPLTLTDWAALPLIGHQEYEAEGVLYRLELRNCGCGSTLADETSVLLVAEAA